MKMRPFAETKSVNRSTHSNVPALQRLRNDFDVYLTNDHNFIVYERRLFTSKMHPKFMTVYGILHDLEPKKYSDIQTKFKLSDGNNINSDTTGKAKHFQRKKYIYIQNSLSIVTLKH